MTYMCQKAHQWLNGKTVIAADDDIPSVELLEFILMRHGANVFRAVNGVEAIELIKAVHPDLVIADLSMPEMTGWDLIHEMRQDEIMATIPVVALTAHALVGVREQTLESGFDAYFSKPYHPMELVRSLADVLHGSAHQGPIQSHATSPASIAG